MEHAMAAGYTGSICETGPVGLTNYKQRKTGQSQGPWTGCTSTCARCPSAKGGHRTPDVDKSGSTSSRSSSAGGVDEVSSDESSKFCSGSQQAKKLQGKEAHSSNWQVPAAGRWARTNGEQKVAQERLQAVSSRRKQLSGDVSTRHGRSAGSPSRQEKTLECREYTHLDHLGKGVFKASLEQRLLFEAVRLDVEAHTRAAGSQHHPSRNLLEVQVLPDKPFAAAMVGMDCDFGSHPAAVVGCWGSTVAAEIHDAMSYNVGPLPLPSPGGSHCCTSQAAAMPAAGGAAMRTGHEVRRGALGDATIAALRKPLKVEKTRKVFSAQEHRR